jgi:hypothetical protein
MADFEVNRRLKKIIEEVYNISPYAFSQKYNDKGGVKTSQVLRERNGLSSKLLEQILEAYPDINRTWLLTGEGEMLKNTSSQKEEEVTAAENAATMITIPQSVWAVIENQAASLKARDESLKIKDEQMNRLITQIEESNSILKTTILGTYTGFPATPTDLGVKNPPPIKSELK